MFQGLTPATARLVAHLFNDQVYCVPRDCLPDAMRCNDFDTIRFRRDSVDLAALKDLSTGELFLLPRSALQTYSVPDEQLGNLVVQFGVRGIGAPYRTQPTGVDPSEVPLHGNVMNPKWASISLGGSCNSRCVFCYTEWIRAVPDLRTEQIKEVIDRIAAIGTVEILVFSGGEATIRRDLVALFEYANQAGFTDLALQTNGRELRKPGLVEKLVEYGLKRVLLSLHGPNARIHDSITESPGSFEEAIEGLYNLQRLSIEPTVNIVMCRENYEHLTEIVVFLDGILHGSGKLRFSYPIVEGAAFDNLDRVLVCFSQLSPLMSAAMHRAEEVGFEVEVANMPLCIPEEGYRNTYDMAVLSEFVEASPFYLFNVSRGEKSVKLGSCSRCSKAALCRGVQVEYLRTYPDFPKEFRPID